MKSIHKVTTCFAGTIIRVNRGPQTECSVLGAKRMSTFRLPKRKSFPDCSPRLWENRKVHVSVSFPDRKINGQIERFVFTRWLLRTTGRIFVSLIIRIFIDRSIIYSIPPYLYNRKLKSNIRHTYVYVIVIIIPGEKKLEYRIVRDSQRH